MRDEVLQKPWREGTAKRDDSALTSPSPAAGAFKELRSALCLHHETYQLAGAGGKASAPGKR